MTVKLQDGKVLLIDGKVSCQCCNSVECDTVVGSGGFTPETTNSVLLGLGLGPVVFTYNSFNLADRFRLVFDGVTLLDTGFVSTQGPVTFEWEKTTATPTARVTVNAPQTNTLWEWSMSCPDSAP